MNRFSQIIILLALGLTGCSTQVVVQTSVPDPLVENTGVPIVLELKDSFSGFTYVEEKEDRLNLSIELGAASAQMSETIFSALGDLSIVTTTSPTAEEQEAGVEMATVSIAENAIKVTPEFLTLQYSIPKENASNVYEVWLKYRFLLTDSGDAVLADWQLNGYGKIADSALEGHESPIREALDIALRDVGAQLAIGFTTQPSVEAWIAQNTPTNAGE